MADSTSYGNGSSVRNSDFSLKIEGIQGESQVKPGYMQIVKFNWGGQQQGSFQYNQGGATGRFSGSDFSFVMKTNTASPVLMQACASGKHFTKATLVCRKAVNQQPMEY